MKNLIKPILNLIFAGLLMFRPAFGQVNITVFNTPVNIDKAIEVGEFPTGFPLSIGASELRDCVARDLSRDNLRDIYAAVVNSIDMAALPKGDPVLGAFFTTAFDDDSLNIYKGKTHGFCFAFHMDKILTMYYFEANGNGKYNWVENLTTRIYSISSDLYISLHYSRFSPGSYPEKSTIFRFTCDFIGELEDDDNSDLTIELSKDYKRLTGLFPLGMADSTILTGIDRPNGDEEVCGGPCHTVVPSTTCVNIVNYMGYSVYTCQVKQRNCAAGGLAKLAKDENISLAVPVEFKKMRDFRDNVMINTCEGRKYTGFYYVFSKYAKMNISMLWKYASILPELYSAMENLSDESSDRIIITPTLRAKALEILRDHDGEGDAYFKSVLAQVEMDLETFTGLKRSELVAMLSPYGNCKGERIAIPGQSNIGAYFTSVYDDPGRDEIVVNYSVSGSRIKFELFSSTAGLVSVIEDPLPRHKFSISTSKMEPGIYIYRISSDSGYEKIGKVAVVK